MDYCFKVRPFLNQFIKKNFNLTFKYDKLNFREYSGSYYE